MLRRTCFFLAKPSNSKPKPPLGTWQLYGASSRLNPPSPDNSTDQLQRHNIFRRNLNESKSSTTSSSLKPSDETKLFSGHHLYANKENAWEGYTDDRFYGAKRFREYWNRAVSDRGMRYYILIVFVLMALGTAQILHIQEQQKLADGLIGPKKKKYNSRLTVIFDLDETLVSFGDKAYRMKAGFVARPYLAELLDYLVSIDAEIIFWTAATDRYAKEILNVIDPKGDRISSVISRNKDWFSKDNYYEKNILWLKRPLPDTIIIENRALSVRSCNANAILVDDFIRGEYMDTGQDYPPNDQALRIIKNIIEDLETSGMPVKDYLGDRKKRNKNIKEIPCHLAMRQLPEELARGVFYFVGDKYAPSGEKTGPRKSKNAKF